MVSLSEEGSKRGSGNYCAVGAGWGSVREKGALPGTHRVTVGVFPSALQQCKGRCYPIHTLEETGLEEKRPTVVFQTRVRQRRWEGKREEG